MVSNNIWKDLTPLPPDEIFGMNQEFKNCKAEKKISLIIGAYRDENGNPKVFDIVKKVEEEMLKANLNKEYLQMEGDQDFTTGAKKLVFGEKYDGLDKIVTVQALSGTGALRLGGTFLNYSVPKGTKIYISDPTWGNHMTVFKHAGLTEQERYPYYDPKTNGLNFKGMMDKIGAAPKGSIILLHACAHNPTGVDPTKEQWKEICDLCKKHELLPFLDMAYQGFATGDLDNDAYAVRLFAKEGLQFLVSESFAKNAGLYGERIGALHIVCANKETAATVMTRVQIDIRGMYSNPPCHGARIMARILNNPAHLSAWKDELSKVSHRIQEMRRLLFDKLIELKTPGKWNHILDQIGMFSFTGLSKEQCELMINKYHVYLLKSGRISMAGINKHNVDYLAKAINDAVVSLPKKE